MKSVSVKKIYKLRKDQTSDGCPLLYYFNSEDFANKLWNYLKDDLKGKDLHEYKNCKKFMNDLNFNFYLTEDFIRKYADILNWNCVCTWQKLNEDFIEEMKDKVVWSTVLENQDLSEEWIRKHTPTFTHERWYHLSMNKHIHLSESFLREFKNELEWCYLSEYYDFTKDFLREVADKVTYSHFCYNNKTHLDENEIEEFALGKDFEKYNEVNTVKDVMYLK